MPKPSFIPAKQVEAVMPEYEIQICVPFDFKHPNNTNTFTVYGVGVIPGPDKPDYGEQFFLVDVETPFAMGDHVVKQLVCAPRYEGDSMDMVMHSACTVGIARVKPEFELSSASTVSPEQVAYCAIGSIKVK